LGFLFKAYFFEAGSFVEVDRPHGVGPCADKDWAVGEFAQVRQELRAYSLLLACGANVCVADEGYILNMLNAHDPGELAIVFVAPERDSIFDFMLEFFLRHVWVVAAIRWDDAFIGLRAIIDDGPDLRKVLIVTAADHRWLPRNS
jgi:hypothetical protein